MNAEVKIKKIILKKLEKEAEKQNADKRDLSIHIKNVNENLKIYFLINNEYILNSKKEPMEYRISDIMGVLGMQTIRALSGGDEPSRVILKGLNKYADRYCDKNKINDIEFKKNIMFIIMWFAKEEPYDFNLFLANQNKNEIKLLGYEIPFSQLFLKK